MFLKQIGEFIAKFDILNLKLRIWKSSIAILILLIDLQYNKIQGMRMEERSIFMSLPASNKSLFTSDTTLNASIRRSQRPQSNSNLSPIPCQICCLGLPSGKFTKCQHQVYCSSCAEASLRESLKKGQKPQCGFINCPASTIDEGGLFKDFDQALKKQYKTMTSNAIARLSRLSLISCQKPDCQGYLDKDTYTCNICQSKHCSVCNRLNHENSCIGSTTFPESLVVKECKLCQGKNYKEGGCPKIKCQRCKVEICYECGEAWSMKHHGCASGGWFLLPWHIFQECCFSAQNTLHEQQTNERIL